MHALLFLALSVLLARSVESHFAAWHPGTLKGIDPNRDDMSHGYPTTPMFQLPFKDWWFNHATTCDEFPPDDGVFLELPANGQFTVELATNRAFTTLAYDKGGKDAKIFGHGSDTIDEGQRQPDGSMPCITFPNIHTQNESMAAGTSFAISYNSELSQVTKENLVVFTTLDNTPWKRVAIYDVPDLPACPEKGCICAWGWIPNGCGEPNIYMQAFRCKVTGQTGTRALANPAPPTWCEDDPTKCTKGAKQMLYWNQAELNNIEVEGNDLSGQPRSPAYNAKCGFANGAQNDIFLPDQTYKPTYVSGTITPTSTSTRDNGASHLMSQQIVIPISIVFVLALLPFFFYL
ncbi:hypothetical protein DL96DRAFT_1611296 [Flagelloscypha sp. PMI_526]|nr:hypothetical protein DL96DRAFT_1611296 [Flagelloscypha sp. PMI_526]